MELKDGVAEYLRAYESRNTFKDDVEICPECHESYDPYYMSYCELHKEREQSLLGCSNSPVTLIKDQQSRINELEKENTDLAAAINCMDKMFDSAMKTNAALTEKYNQLLSMRLPKP